MAEESETPRHPFRGSSPRAAVPRVDPAQLSIGPQTPFLLDVRTSTERTWVRLPHDHHIPLSELAGRLRELPRDRPIVTYDHRGTEARRAAELLLGSGFADVSALEGGVDEYARRVDPSLPRYPPGIQEGLFLLRAFPRAETGCLAYLVTEPNSRQAVVIDPGREPEPYLRTVAEEGLTLVAIMETHTHADHLAGHATLHERTGAPIYLGRRSP
ncbi:MAG: MBL fold metallo-hydrolase, partial [Thermoplasmata archaeon]|nr:MBL fold metallo-hydrolase [Thermoplasmata archaeon]